MSAQTDNRRLETAAITAICLGFIIWSALFIYRSSFVEVDGRRYFCLFDDAMISMRYAWNLSHGLGLIWNTGERVAGYSNLLMTLLMALPTLVFDKSTAVLSIQIAGAGFMLATAYLSMKIADRITRGETAEHRTLARVLAFLCALSYYPLAYWSLMGMETGLLTVLLLSSVLAALSLAAGEQPASPFLPAATLGLAFLTRNDSIVFAIPVWAYIIRATPNLTTGHKARRRLAAALAVYLLFVIGQFAFNRLYYGDWLPNTFTLKLTGLPLPRRLEIGIDFVARFLAETSGLLTLSVLAVVLRLRLQKLLLLSLALAALAYQAYVGGDAWQYWRIMAPTVPLLGVLLISSAIALTQKLLSQRPARALLGRRPDVTRRYVGGALIASVTLVGMLSANWRFLPEFSLRESAYQVADNERNINVALAISQVTTEAASVGVYWAGSIPYYTGRKAIDFLGRSDSYIAHLPANHSGRPGHDKYDLEYSIKTLLPTFTQYPRWREQDLSSWAATRYASVTYKDIHLFLLRDSPTVLWDRVRILDP